MCGLCPCVMGGYEVDELCSWNDASTPKVCNDDHYVLNTMHHRNQHKALLPNVDSTVGHAAGKAQPAQRLRPEGSKAKHANADTGSHPSPSPVHSLQSSLPLDKDMLRQGQVNGVRQTHTLVLQIHVQADAP